MQGERWAAILGWVIVAAVIAGGAWLWFGSQQPPEPRPSVEPAEPASRRTEPAQPRYPVRAPAEDRERRDLRELPSLDDSDEYFRLDLASLFGDSAAASLVRERLIERIVATVDNLPRPHVAERIRPVAALDGALIVDSQDGSGEYLLSQDNYDRYDLLVGQFAAVDVVAAAEVYRRYYPLFQNAYVGLGYPDGYFNDRLIEVIDHLLATPDVREPVTLLRPHVLYRYADPDLEDLSSGQKLLVRIGPAHRERVKETLRSFRAQLTGDER